MAKSWKFKGGVVFGMLVIIVPLLYELWDAGVIKLPGDESVEWHGIKKLSCGGNEELVLDQRTVHNTDKLLPAMVSVTGNCQLRVLGGTIKGYKIIWAAGNGRVSIEDAKLHAEHTAVYLGGSARLTIKNSTVAGKKAALHVAGGARVTYDDKSKIEGRKRGRRKNIVKGVVGETP